MKKIPDCSRLEAAVKRIRFADYAILSALCVVDLFLVWEIVKGASWMAMVVPLTLLAVSTIVHLGWSLTLFAEMKIQVADLADGEKVGPYSAAEVKELVKELREPYRTRETPSVFVIEPKFEGAYVVNSLFFTVLRPLNAVYVSRYLFTLLRPVELKAILAHEFAHFYGYIRPLNQARFSLMVFNALLPAYMVMDEAGAIAWSGALTLWLFFSVVFLRVVNVWLSWHARSYEFLCDLSAARRFGLLSMINGLMQVVKSLEAQARIHALLLARIRKDDALSIDELQTLCYRCEKRLPEGPLSVQEIERALEEELCSEETGKLRKPLSAKQLKKEEKAVEELAKALCLKKEFKLINWGRFDTAIPDGRVDATEYPGLIDALESEPGAQLFDLAIDNAELVANGSHPTVRERILFLEKRRREDPTLLL